HAVLGELVQRVRPVVPVDEVEIGVAGVIRDCAPVPRVLHGVNDRAVAARGLAEAAAVLARGEGAELAVDERDDLAREVVGVVADRGRVDVLVAAERGEAVGKHDDDRAHLPFMDEPRGTLGDVVAERLPADVREAGAGEADQVVEHRKSSLAGMVVFGGQPDRELAHVRIAQRVVLQDLRDVLEDEGRARIAFEALEGHFSTITRMRFEGSSARCAPFGTSEVMSPSKPASIVMSPKAAPCTRIGFTLLKTSASGTTRRDAISCSIHALATP